MKKKWLVLRVAAGLWAALGWWGLIYPELTLTPDTVNIYREDENGELCALPREWSFEDGLYLELLSAPPEKITLRSRLLTNLNLLWEALHEKDGPE